MGTPKPICKTTDHLLRGLGGLLPIQVDASVPTVVAGRPRVLGPGPYASARPLDSPCSPLSKSPPGAFVAVASYPDTWEDPKSRTPKKDPSLLLGLL